MKTKKNTIIYGPITCGKVAHTEKALTQSITVDGLTLREFDIEHKISPKLSDFIQHLLIQDINRMDKKVLTKLVEFCKSKDKTIIGFITIPKETNVWVIPNESTSTCVEKTISWNNEQFSINEDFQVFDFFEIKSLVQ